MRSTPPLRALALTQRRKATARSTPPLRALALTQPPLPILTLQADPQQHQHQQQHRQLLRPSSNPWMVSVSNA